jgi:hypothetical protein
MSDITHIISALEVTGSSSASTHLLANIPLKEAQDRLKPHPVKFQFESCHRSKFQRREITLQYASELSPPRTILVAASLASCCKWSTEGCSHAQIPGGHSCASFPDVRAVHDPSAGYHGRLSAPLFLRDCVCANASYWPQPHHSQTFAPNVIQK